MADQCVAFSIQEQGKLPNSSFYEQLAGDALVPLRAAAVATDHWLHVFGMNAKPPVCHVLPPWLKLKRIFITFVKVTSYAKSKLAKKAQQPAQAATTGKKRGTPGELSKHRKCQTPGRTINDLQQI